MILFSIPLMVKDDGAEGTDGTGIGISREEGRRYLASIRTMVMMTTMMMAVVEEGWY